MTRRNFIFKCKDGRYAVSPEFNGDKKEFEYFNSSDKCDITFKDMKSIMSNVYTLQDFLSAIKAIEESYHSSISGCVYEMAIYHNSLAEIKSNDNVYLVGDGKCTIIEELSCM